MLILLMSGTRKEIVRLKKSFVQINLIHHQQYHEYQAETNNILVSDHVRLGRIVNEDRSGDLQAYLSLTVLLFNFSSNI